MPTTDPVKRRKQNCENQKRWRQRQFDALEKSQSRIRELEIESDDLRTRLQVSQAEVEALRAATGRLEAQASLSLGHKRSIHADVDRHAPTSRDSNVSLTVSEGQRPPVKEVQASTVNGSSQGNLPTSRRKIPRSSLLISHYQHPEPSPSFWTIR